MDSLSSPSTIDGVIARPRLLTSLAPDRIIKIRLLCAPAGFGKTVLARQFSELDHTSRVLWLSLSSNQPLTSAVLIARISVALGLPETDKQGLFKDLAKVLDACANTLIVLDDYLPNTDTDTWLLDFIHQSNCQWLITARHKPKWPLGRLLLEGQLIEFNSEDLELTLSELASILAFIAPKKSFCARSLYEQTNGWVAGVRLFLYSQTNRQSHMQTNLHRSPYLLDYLDQEILELMSLSDRHLLNVIAHAPFVDSAICSVISGETFSLQQLMARQSFLRTLPGSTDRFTVYEPLRSVLRERNPDDKKALIGVLDWLELSEQSVILFIYAIKVAEATRAVKALTKVTVDKLFAENNLSLVLSGLNELEVANFTHHPKALIVATRSLIMAGNLELAESYLSALPDQQQWLGSKLAIQAELALHRGQAQDASRLSDQALVELNNNEDWTQMILSFSCMTRAQLALGQYEQAQRQQIQGLELARLKGKMLLECQLLLDQAQGEELAGHLHRALQVLDKLKVLIGQSGGSILLSGSERIRRGWLLMLTGDDASARLPLEQGQELSMTAGTPVFFYSYILLAQIDARNGNPEQAQQRLAEVQRALYGRAISEPIYRSVLTVGNASIELLAQHYQPVVGLLERLWQSYNDPASLSPPSSTPELFALMSFLHAQALTSQGSLDKAIQVLTQVLEKAEGFGFQVIVSQALMALGKARHQRGDMRQAERLLASATVMAIRQGQGQILSEDQSNSAIAFNENAKTKTLPTTITASTESLLSPREHVVLELIAKGHSNAEISEILSISVHTVKAHAKRINAKFQVNRRALAVARAKTLGLLL